MSHANAIRCANTSPWFDTFIVIWGSRANNENGWDGSYQSKGAQWHKKQIIYCRNWAFLGVNNLCILRPFIAYLLGCSATSITSNSKPFANGSSRVPSRNEITPNKCNEKKKETLGTYLGVHVRYSNRDLFKHLWNLSSTPYIVLVYYGPS